MGGGLEHPVPSPAQVKCCGWVSFLNWTENPELMNRTNITFPCSCKKSDEEDALALPQKGFCEAPFGNRTQSGNNPLDWPVYQEVRGWLLGGRLGAQWIQTLRPPASPGPLLHQPFFAELFLPSFDSSACHLHLHLCVHQWVHPRTTQTLLYRTSGLGVVPTPGDPVCWGDAGHRGVTWLCSLLVGLHGEGAGLAAGEPGRHPRRVCGRRCHRGLVPSLPTPAPRLPPPKTAPALQTSGVEGGVG